MMPKLIEWYDKMVIFGLKTYLSNTLQDSFNNYDLLPLIKVQILRQKHKKLIFSNL